VVANLVALAVLGWLVAHPGAAAAGGERAMEPAGAGFDPVHLERPPRTAEPEHPSTGSPTPAPSAAPAILAHAAADVARPATAAPNPPRTSEARCPPTPATTSPAGSRPAPPSSAARALGDAVEREIARAVARAKDASRGQANGASCTVAVHVRELGGPELVARLAGTALRPASNLKLVTCATALVLLGPDARFETPFEARGEVRAGVLHGDLVARAGGDPLYRAGGDGSIDPWAEDLARQLRAAGIQEVGGDLVLDEGRFLVPGPGPAWPDARDHWQEYCALSGGFSANAGSLTAIVRPGAVGAAASVRVRPADHGLERKVDVTTGPRRSSLSVAVEARARGVVVRGRIPSDVSEYRASFAYPDPVDLFGHALVGGLARAGVPVRGGLRRERDARGGPRVATLASPVADALVPILRDSHNAVADQLFFATAHQLGLPGDREGGFAATRRALERLSVSTEGFVQRDGSGLSRDDRISPRQLTALLAAVLEGEPRNAELFRAALPVAGESGSLSDRMRSGPARGKVRAKTGFIGGTSALSGLVETEDARTLVFSIQVEYPRVDGLNTRAWKPMQDAICEHLVRWTGAGR